MVASDPGWWPPSKAILRSGVYFVHGLFNVDFTSMRTRYLAMLLLQKPLVFSMTTFS